MIAQSNQYIAVLDTCVLAPMPMTNDPKNNVKHLRPEAAKPYDLDILTPDDLLVHQFHFNDELLMEKLAAQAAARKVSIDALLDRLQQFRAELRQTAPLGPPT